MIFKDMNHAKLAVYLITVMSESATTVENAEAGMSPDRYLLTSLAQLRANGKVDGNLVLWLERVGYPALGAEAILWLDRMACELKGEQWVEDKTVLISPYRKLSSRNMLTIEILMLMATQVELTSYL